MCTRARRVVKSTRDDSRSTLPPSLSLAIVTYVPFMLMFPPQNRMFYRLMHVHTRRGNNDRPLSRAFIYSEAAEIFGTAPHPHFPLSIIHRRGSIISANNDLSPLLRTNRAVGIIRGRKQGGGLPPLDESINNRNQVKFKLAAVPYAESPV